MDASALTSEINLNAPFGSFPEIDEIAQTASIIGVGESVHGCGTYHRASLNIARYLIEHHGFRLFLLEAPAVSVNPIQEYIDGSNADINAWLRHGFKVWLSIELVAFIGWLKEFNSRIRPDRVMIRGFDVQNPWLELKELSSLSLPAHLDRFLSRFNLHWTPQLKPDDVKAFQTQLRTGQISIDATELEVLTSELKAPAQNRELVDYGQRFSERNIMQKIAAWLESLAFSKSDTPRALAARDLGMAADIAWAVNAYGVKSFVMAHNGHLVYQPQSLLPKTDYQNQGDLMGSRLRFLFGDKFSAIGMIAHHLTVWDIPVQQTRPIVFWAGLEGELAKVKSPVQFLKPSSLPGDHHIIGAPTEWSDPEDELDHKMEGDLKKQLDLLLYIPIGEAFDPASV